MIFKITNQDNDKYLICSAGHNFVKLIDIIKQFNMYHIFILNSNVGDTFNMEELAEEDYNHVLCRFKDDENCFNNKFKSKQKEEKTYI